MPKIRQLDGVDDDGSDDDDDNENDGADSEITSDLDDEDSEENLAADHLVLCQYEKVSRIKSKWKCVLKDGIASINGRDYVFSRVKIC